MKPNHFTRRVTASFIGWLMLAVLTELLVRTAYLDVSRDALWLWGVLLAAILMITADGSSEQLKRSRAVAAAVGGAVLALSQWGLLGSFVSHGPKHWFLALADNQIQIWHYLTGSLAVLPEPTQAASVHWLSFVVMLLVLWARSWPRRQLVLGGALLFGALRWHQYVPDLDAPMVGLALLWCFQAALFSGSEFTEARMEGLRLRAAILMTVGVLVGTLTLSALFPLEAVNRWMGTRLLENPAFRNEYPHSGQTGFSLEHTFWQPLGSRLGGPVILEKHPVMSVRSSQPGVYLRGMVRTTYTGSGWTAPRLELKPMAPRPDTTGERPFVLVVEPFDSREPTVFAPLNTVAVTGTTRPVLSGREGLFRFGSGFLPVKPSTYRILGYAQPGDNAPPPDFTPYLELPPLSPAFTALAHSVAGQEGTDSERLERLIRWLRSEGRYRLDAAVPDPSRDFVEQFVLGSREGYCTYFASALAVMGRVAGIPTRYVEGYRLPDQVPGRQTYLVTSDRAHAWVEAYLAGTGWVVAEATPIFSVPGATTNLQGDLDPLTPPADAHDSAAPGAGSGEISQEQTLSWNLWLAGFAMILIALVGIRILWVERCWHRGVRGPERGVWLLYGILSALTVLDPSLKTQTSPTERLGAAHGILDACGYNSRDIIGEANRLLYGNVPGVPEDYPVMLGALWRAIRRQHGTAVYLIARYGSLNLFNSYYPLMTFRQYRKEPSHGADQPYPPTQS